MKKLYCLLFVGLVVSCAIAKEPTWINTMQTNYLIVSAEGATPEIAQQKAMNKVRQRVMESIAQQVSASSNLTERETSLNGTYFNTSEYVSEVSTKTVAYPFLSGITESNVEESYLEPIKNKKEIVSYRFHIKYPYSQFDMLRYVDQFLEYQQNLDDQLESFRKDDFSSYASVEEMQSRISALESFKLSLLENDARRAVCDQVKKHYLELLKTIRISAEQVTREGLWVYCYFGDHKVAYQARPTLRSECLMNIQGRMEGNGWHFTYSYDGCYTDEPNKVKINNTIQGVRVDTECYIR